MAYNPPLYNPYSQNQPWSWSQPTQLVTNGTNGLAFIDSISDLDTLQMTPGSISQPYFLKDEDKFVIVTFDKVGGSTKELFSFKKEQMPTNNNQGEFVTREYFDQQINNIMEAINGKHAISTPTKSTAITAEPAATD